MGRILRILTAALALTAAGCGLHAQKTTEANLTPNVVAAAEPEQSTGCKVASDPFNPFIVEWPAAERTNLEAQSQAGLVVVSYVGCTLKVLAGCEAVGVYDVRHTTPNTDHFDMQTEEDLYAKLPLGAATLKGELKSAGAMRFEYVAAAQSVAKAPPTALRGTCEGATHYVRSMTKGAFSLGALASSTAETVGEVGRVGAGGLGASRGGRTRASGDLAACRGGDYTKCGAILQLGLADLSIGTQEAGFGEGLGHLVEIPPGPASEVALPQMDFSKANPEYLELVDAAKKADNDKRIDLSGKAARWERVVAYAGENPYQEEARQRASAWAGLERRRQEREAQVAAAHQQYEADRRKLDRLLAISEETVTVGQKAAYRREFAQVYTPWRRAFEAAGLNAENPSKGQEVESRAAVSVTPREIADPEQWLAIGLAVGSGVVSAEGESRRALFNLEPSLRLPIGWFAPEVAAQIAVEAPNTTILRAGGRLTFEPVYLRVLFDQMVSPLPAPGATAGVGVEWPISENWSVQTGVEANYWGVDAVWLEGKAGVSRAF